MAGCGGFTCSKNALAALNILYILVALLLISVAGYGRMVAVITSPKNIGGIIACGVFLLVIALVGLIGAVKHHQVLLFFYMIVLFLLFLVQFAVACACLAVNPQQQKQLATQAWRRADVPLKNKVQTLLKCCGFEDQDLLNGTEAKKDLGLGHPVCSTLDCCKGTSASRCCVGAALNATVPPHCGNEGDRCGTCWAAIKANMDKALKIAGGIGLFFSFTEIIGVWLALRYRNQKDPRANPSAFL